MPDLEELLGGVDRVPVPDAWEQIRGRDSTAPPIARRTPAIVVGAAAAVIAVAVAWFAFRPVGGAPTIARRSFVNGPIVFSAPRPRSAGPVENTDLYRLDPRTGVVTDLTNTARVSEEDAVWSPDGSRVAFERVRYDGGAVTSQQVVVANADLTHTTTVRACDRACDIWDLTWSPDDDHLAWVTGGAVNVADVSTGSVRTLCRHPECPYPDQLAWSPDGTRLAFSNNGTWRLPSYLVPNRGPIWIADVLSGRLDAVTSTPLECDPATCVFDSSPAWSPDGTRIAFVRSSQQGRVTATTDVMVMNADGTGLRRLSRCASTNRCLRGPLAWGPHGRTVAFVDRYDTPTLRLIDVIGHRRVRIALPERAPGLGGLTWSPDGTSIALLAGTAHGGVLYRIGTDHGTIEVLLRHMPGVHGMQWLPASLPTP
jgi:Tol biopolymer transport system component